MPRYATARRAALLSLLVTIALAGSLGPASAVLVGDPYRHDLPNPYSPPSLHHSHVVAGSGPGLLIWLLVGVTAALLLGGIAFLIARRYRHAHRAMLSA